MPYYRKKPIPVEARQYTGPYRLRTTNLGGGTPRTDALLGIDRVIVEEVVIR